MDLLVDLLRLLPERSQFRACLVAHLSLLVHAASNVIDEMREGRGCFGVTVEQGCLLAANDQEFSEGLCRLHPGGNVQKFLGSEDRTLVDARLQGPYVGRISQGKRVPCREQGPGLLDFSHGLDGGVRVDTQRRSAQPSRAGIVRSRFWICTTSHGQSSCSRVSPNARACQQGRLISSYGHSINLTINLMCLWCLCVKVRDGE